MHPTRPAPSVTLLHALGPGGRDSHSASSREQPARVRGSFLFWGLRSGPWRP